MSSREFYLGKIAGVFRGKGAKYNKAIFRILANRGPQGYYDLRRLIEQELSFAREKSVSYSVINRRVKALEREDHIYRVSSKKSKAGLDIPIFSLTLKGSLAALLLIEKGEIAQLEKFLDNISENPVCRLASFLIKKGVSKDFIWDLFITGIKNSLAKGLINLDIAVASDIINVLNSSLLIRLKEMSNQLLEEKENLNKVCDVLKTEDGKIFQAEIYGTEMGLQLGLSSFVMEKTDLRKLNSARDILIKLEKDREKIKKSYLDIVKLAENEEAVKDLRYLSEVFEMIHYGFYEFFDGHLGIRHQGK